MRFSRFMRVQCKHWTLKKFSLIVAVIYVTITLISTIVILNKLAVGKNNKLAKTSYTLPDLTDEDASWNPWGGEFAQEDLNITKSHKKKQISWDNNRSLDFGKPSNAKPEDADSEINHIEIWSKCDLGLYFWWHIFDGGKLEKKMGGIWYYGFKKYGYVKFKFRSGSGVIPSKAPNDVENLILILAADNEEHIEFANIWLTHITKLPLLRNVALIVLGSNDMTTTQWIAEYYNKARRGFDVNSKRSYMSSVLQIVYLVNYINDSGFNSTGAKHKVLYPWPLGVDISRQFPKIRLKHIDVQESRSYHCSIVLMKYHSVRVYKHIITTLAHHHIDTCKIWSNISSSAPGAVMRLGGGRQGDVGLSEYVGILLDSDIIICPPSDGTAQTANHLETYQIYEAMSAGSVPVTLHNTSSHSHSRGIAVLAYFNAPIIYLNTWDHLPRLLAKEANYTLQEKINRRLKVLTWYHKFKHALREQMFDLISERFFNKRRWEM